MSDTTARAAIARMNMNPVAVSPVHSVMISDLQQMSKADIATEHEKAMARRGETCAAFGFDNRAQNKPFAFADGIAFIPVTGTLVNRFGGSYGYITGYNAIRRQLNQAMADDDVKGIVLDVNSNGGEAAGCFELADEIREMRAAKPIMAVVDSNCYSAAYAIASAASQIVVTPSGGAGSIGVVAMHVNMGKMLSDFGIDITFIKFGDHKVDGNPFEALSDDVKKSIQASVDKTGERFVSLVATNRSMDADKVRATQARVYQAEEALGLGLIDKIATPSQAVKLFYDGLTGSQTQLKGNGMTQQSEDTKPAQNAQGNETQTPAAAAPVQTPAAAAPVQTPAAESTDARTQERARISSIVSCDEAKGKGALANHLAMNTDMSLESAKAVLSAAAVEQPAQGASNGFAAAMAGTQNPNMDAGAAPAGEQTAAQRILQAQSAATGIKFN